MEFISQQVGNLWNFAKIEEASVFNIYPGVTVNVEIVLQGESHPFLIVWKCSGTGSE